MLKFFFIQTIIILIVKNSEESVPQNTKAPNMTGKDLSKIVDRKTWEAREPTSHMELSKSPAPYVIIHHGGLEQHCHDQASCSEIVRFYQKLHMDERGWSDIGYNFVIGQDGSVYEGRGWDNTGAHAPGYNNRSIGICIIGDFSKTLPNKNALKALNSLISKGVKSKKISSNYKLLAHRQVKVTKCPGKLFYNYIKKMPRFQDKRTWH